MKIIFDLMIVLAIIIVLDIFVIRLRSKLLKLWKEVSVKEVLFHNLLLEVTILFYENKNLLHLEENQQAFKKIARYRKKKLRNLLLKERQDLFSYLNEIYDDIEEVDDPTLEIIKKKFNELQKARRLYNTKVLLYNQSISIFPTRFLAIKMNLQLKEYFG